MAGLINHQTTNLCLRYKPSIVVYLPTMSNAPSPLLLPTTDCMKALHDHLIGDVPLELLVRQADTILNSNLIRDTTFFS